MTSRDSPNADESTEQTGDWPATSDELTEQTDDWPATSDELTEQTGDWPATSDELTNRAARTSWTIWRGLCPGLSYEE